jgi:hypothetical protein
MERAMRKRTKRTRTPAQPVVSVGTFDKDSGIDWTPEKNRIYPRIVTAKQGKLFVNIEEARDANNRYCFFLGVGDGGGNVLYNLVGEEFSPENLDLFISLLVAARDKARELGMPTDKRNGAAA